MCFTLFREWILTLQSRKKILLEIPQRHLLILERYLWRIRNFNLSFLSIIYSGSKFMFDCYTDLLIQTACTSIMKKVFQTCPPGIYLFKVNNRNTRARCEICSKLTIKTPEQHQWRRFGVFIVYFEHISHLALLFLLLIWTGKCLLGEECTNFYGCFERVLKVCETNISRKLVKVSIFVFGHFFIFTV